MKKLLPSFLKKAIKQILCQTWLERRWIIRKGSCIAKYVAKPLTLKRIPTAALIFSRYHWENEHQCLAGSGRMQQEAYNCLKKMGFQTYFAGQEDSVYPPKIIHADLIVTLAPPLVRLPGRCTGISCLYTCNSHVLERNKRIQTAEQTWQVPCETESLRDQNQYLIAYRRADYLLIAENDQGIKNFLTHGIPPKKIRRYNNCVDTDIWIPTKRKRNKFTFVSYTSSHGLRKGLPVILSAWNRWYKGQDTELWLVGTPSTVSDLLMNGSRKGEIRPGLHVCLQDFPAQHKPVIDFVSSCHVAVFPTIEDAQPSSLLEMASCGLPIITTIESGVEFPQEFCRYIKINDPDSLMKAFQYWFDKRLNLEKTSLAVRKFVKNNHDWSCFRNQFTSIISEITNVFF